MLKKLQKNRFAKKKVINVSIIIVIKKNSKPN